MKNLSTYAAQAMQHVTQMDGMNILAWVLTAASAILFAVTLLVI